MIRQSRPTGMLAFTVVWIGQLVSILGTVMTGFALSIWAWQTTGEATALALVSFFTFAPTVLVSPLAGALVDRWNRKLVMMLSDLAAVLSTVVVLLLYLAGGLQIWHLYATGAFAGAFYAFQRPAYSAAITTMMPKKHYGRASGMLSVARFAPNIFAPVLAALLLNLIGLAGILTIDVVTFLVAVATLLSVHVPQPPITEEGRKSKGSLWKESVYGFGYIRERRSLLGLTLLVFAANLAITFGVTVLAPMLLARTGDDTTVYGVVLSAMGLGGLAGGTLMSVWGGPKRRINGVLVGLTLAMAGVLVIGLGRDPYVWAFGGFLALFFVPIISGSSEALWQAKVAPDVQGRVFASRNLFGQISAPAAMLMAGPLADRVFEPSLMPGGSLASMFGGLVGTGPGAGMSLMFVFAGVLGMLVGLGGYAFHAVRNVESILPDYGVEVALPEED